MNFYSVKIGQRTKRGNFNESVSFVCKTDNKLFSDISDYCKKQFLGFDVLVSLVEDIKEVTISDSYSFSNKDSEEVKGYKKEILELQKQVKTETTEYYKSKIEEKDFPDELITMITEIKEIENNLKSLRNKASSYMQDHIKNINKGKFYWVKADDGFSDGYQWYKYQGCLNGTLIISREPEDLKV